MIRISRYGKRLRVATGESFFALAALIQVQLAVQTVHAFVVPMVAPTSKNLKQLAEPVSGIPLNRGLQRSDNLVISALERHISMHRLTDANRPASQAF